MPVEERSTTQKMQVRQTFEYFQNETSKFTTFTGAIMCAWLLSPKSSCMNSGCVIGLMHLRLQCQESVHNSFHLHQLTNP